MLPPLPPWRGRLGERGLNHYAQTADSCYLPLVGEARGGDVNGYVV